jgi:hypothetical protein
MIEASVHLLGVAGEYLVMTSNARWMKGPVVLMYSHRDCKSAITERIRRQTSVTMACWRAKLDKTQYK